MSSYRCYFLDLSDRIGGVYEIDARCDLSALERARTLLTCEPQHFTAVEVWHGPRKVGLRLTLIPRAGGQECSTLSDAPSGGQARHRLSWCGAMPGFSTTNVVVNSI